jgi:hypothetical protein
MKNMERATALELIRRTTSITVIIYAEKNRMCEVDL